MPHVVELGNLFNGLEFKLFRGNANDVLGYLKRGDVELGLGAPFGEEWDVSTVGRFSPRTFSLSSTPRIGSANNASVPLAELQKERLMVRNYCELTRMLLELLRSREFDVARYHETSAESDLLALLDAGVGVALVPRSTSAPNPRPPHRCDSSISAEPSSSMALQAGNAPPVASALMKMLRAFDWSRFSAAA